MGCGCSQKRLTSLPPYLSHPRLLLRWNHGTFKKLVITQDAAAVLLLMRQRSFFLSAFLSSLTNLPHHPHILTTFPYSRQLQRAPLSTTDTLVLWLRGQSPPHLSLLSFNPLPCFCPLCFFGLPIF